MCFSAGASFGASAVLALVGTAAIRQSRTPAQMVFASIPLIFAVQQASEGLVWLSILHTSFAHWQQPATYIFLLFAQVLWPVWVPFAVLLLEKEKGRKKWLYLCLASGLLVSFYLAWRLLTQTVTSEIIGMHIFYKIGISGPMLSATAIVYFITTVLAPLISSVKKMWYFGLSIAISYIVAEVFYDNYVISVWCFFAAIISIAVFTIILDLKKTFLEGRGFDRPKQVIASPD